LPEEREEFVRLVYRAFCAPQPEPEEEAVCHLIGDLAGCLWDRLRIFDAVVKCETVRLNQSLDQMADTPPDQGRNHVRERCWWIEGELKDTALIAERTIGSCATVLSPQLRALMVRCYGSHPDIERFGNFASHSQGFF
jgi:hypothetical protein